MGIKMSELVNQHVCICMQRDQNTNNLLIYQYYNESRKQK